MLEVVLCIDCNLLSTLKSRDNMGFLYFTYFSKNMSPNCHVTLLYVDIDRKIARLLYKA